MQKLFHLEGFQFFGNHFWQGIYDPRII